MAGRPRGPGRPTPMPAGVAVSLAAALLVGLPAGAPAQEVPGGGTAAADSGRLDGFTPASSRRQRALERRFLAVPSAEGVAETSGWLAAEPHMAGTRRQAELADSLARRLRGMGFEVEVERYGAHLPHPDSLGLELITPGGRRSLAPREAGDLSGSYAWSWNAYAADGTARGEVVYANYGRAEDYRALEEAGVRVAGRIVLARYGAVYRGVKVREAEERGADGVVLFTDPADGGFADGDTLPGGPYRPAGSVQRGTASYLWRYPGDPLTPGRPARPGVSRLHRDSARNLPGIPVLNVSAARAREILDALGGPAAPPGFRGGWSLPYRLGGGPARLRMTVRQDTERRPVRNVLARLPGREPGTVIVGVHFDAWVRGGVDPHSGTGAVLEIARGLAELQEEGWRPRRTILLGFWGGEEFGAVGSTEFVEAHRRQLEEDAVAYFNVDVLTAGALDVSGSPSLRDLVWDAARRVEDPLQGRSLADAWRTARADSGAARPSLRPLGVGSDWTAFFHHAGVPSLQWTMNGRGTYAVYHSAHDDFRYLRSHADSALLYTPAMARVMGVAALRLAEADALPFDYLRYAERVVAMVGSLAGPAAGGGDLGSLRSAARELRRAAGAVRAARRRSLARGDTAALRRMNRLLPRGETALLRPIEAGGPAPGSDGRRWYRHMVYGPEPATGYGALPLPALQPERATGGPAAAPSVGELTEALRRAAGVLREAARRRPLIRGPAAGGRGKP